jgi:hypothetical protein
MVRTINPACTILTHIEEQDGYSHDDLNTIAATLQDEGHRIEFAYDTLVVDVG